jgi:uncharacterized membrane-anchored protein
MRRQVVAAFVAVALSLSGASLALAQGQAGEKVQEQAIEFNPMTDPSVQKSMREVELKFAYDNAAKTAQHGPADVALSDEAVLKLPAGYIFVPQKEAALVMGAMGNPITVTFLGMITSEASTDDWFITVDFNKAGYLREEDARSWSPDRLLVWLKNGVEATNKASFSQGLPALEVKGWADAPQYNPITRRLTWAAVTDEKDAPADSNPFINYQTFTLGRNGYLALKLIANRNALNADKKHIEKILDSVTFNEGKRYQDFTAGKDKVAEFGLSALVANPTEALDVLGDSNSFLGKTGKLLILLAVGALIIVFWRFRSSRAA